jgi:outer membrane protein
MKRLVGVMFFTLALLSMATAQKQWTLQECIQYALDNNIQIKRQELLTKVDQKEYQQSKYNMLPSIGANGDHTWSSGRSFNTNTGTIFTGNNMSDQFTVYGNITLFSGFQVKNTIVQNKFILEKSLQDYQKAKNDICLQIATVFLQILFNQEALAIAESQLQVTTLQVEKTGRLVDAGNKPKGELFQIQAQEANEKYNVINAKNNLNISYLTLVQMLELQSTEGFSVSRPDSISINNTNVLSSVNDIYTIAESNFPEIKSADLNLKSSEKGLDISRGEFYPKLTMSAGYNANYSQNLKKQNNESYPFFEQVSDNNNKYLSFGLNIPIFSKFQTRTNVSKAKIRVLDAQYNLNQSKKELYQEIQKAHADASAAFERYNAANEAVVFNEESFKYVQQKYDLGIVNSVDYNIAKSDLIRAKSNFIQAKYEYVFKLKVLDFYKGLPIVL